MTKYAYCKICDKQVENPVRKPMQTFQKVIWVMVSIATVGVGAIIFAIVYGNRKKIHCPTCRAKVQISSKPHGKVEKEEELTQRERILKKAGKAKEEKIKSEEEAPPEIPEEEEVVEQTFCPYCGEDIDKGISRCPYCHSALTIR